MTLTTTAVTVGGAPSPYSTVLPRLQVVWDSTSLRALMECPRKYQYAILRGLRPLETNPHLAFGGFFASAVEAYKKSRLEGLDKQSATYAAVRYAIEATWNSYPCPCPDGCNGCTRPEGPWGGRYQSQWRCTGTNPYRNAKGNRAKCPFSHARVWVSGAGPDVCGTCGSPTHTERRWVGDDRVKDRPTLVRLVAGYCDAQAETEEDGLYPVAFPDGTPAVELSFKLPLPWKAQPYFDRYEGDIPPREAERYVLAGHMDSIMSFAGEHFITDNKTTGKGLTPSYWAGYSPNIQVDVYGLAGSLLFPHMELRGVAIEAAQVQAGGKVTFGMRMFRQDDHQREELLGDLEHWLRQAESYARADHWPMNRSACYLCQFKPICSRPAAKREAYIAANYQVQHWNPADER